jgi:hypothetical protein
MKMNRKIIRTYSELIQLETFEERFEYLRLDGMVGKDTFGFDRYLNQLFYNSLEWKQIRNFVISRDCGCDLGVIDHEIYGKVLIHHMNPLTRDDIINKTDYLLNPEYLICVSFETHQAIHYGNNNYINDNIPIQRRKNDTCPWRH